MTTTTTTIRVTMKLFTQQISSSSSITTTKTLRSSWTILCPALATLCLLLISQQLVSAHIVQKAGCSTSQYPAFKVDCHPEPEASESVCLLRGCCWSVQANESNVGLPYVGTPSCFFPSDFQCSEIASIKHLYGDADERQHRWRDLRPLDDDDDDGDVSRDNGKGDLWSEASGIRFLLVRKQTCPPSGLPDDAKALEVTIRVHGESIINIKIREKDRWRFEPSLPEIRLPRTRRRKSQVGGGGRNGLPGNNDYDDDERTERKLRLGQLVVSVQTNNNNSNNKHNGGKSQQAGVMKVIHQISGAILFETDLGKLIYSRHFIQLPTSLPSAYIYGLGQHMGDSLLKSSHGHYAKSYTMFNYGHPPQPDGRSAYSTYPFYINLAQLPAATAVASAPNDTTDYNLMDAFERRRKIMATGALMLNSNAMDVLVHSSVDTDSTGNRRAGVTWRMVGGIVDLYLFAGPQPRDVIYQYQSLVGQPALPPAWALGYHQSRYNYRELLPIKLAWARTRSAGIPMESIWTDLEFLWRSTSYTLNNAELNDLVRILQNEYGMHYVPIVDPAISVGENEAEYEALRLANSMDLFASYLPKDGMGESSPARVTTWCDSQQSALLDFTHPLVVGYLEKVLADYRTKLSFDGIWLDMNEPETFSNIPDKDGQVCPYDEEIPYLPGGRKLNDRTVCMAAEFRAGKHYDLHNLIAFYQSKAHYEALERLRPTKRPFIISRSHFVGQGKYSGSWLGDAQSNFDALRWSLVGTIESNWFGQPMTGSDICGFFGATTDELCARWFSVGAFYPFSRNHNDGSSRDQDPGALGEIVQKAARLALMKRYSMLPYLYTLFQENHRLGEPVVRSVLFENFDQYYLNSDLESLPQIDDQLMWGQALMIAPVLHPDSDSRSVYLPPGRWYDVSLGLPGTDMHEGNYDGLKSNWPLGGSNADVQLGERAQARLNRLRRPMDCLQANGCWLENQFTPLGAVNLYLRGGKIVPTFRSVDHTVSVDRMWKNATFFLEIGLGPTDEAYGSLYWDSGESKPDLDRYNLANFWLSRNKLSILAVEERYEEPLQFDGFVVYGVKSYMPANSEPIHYRGAQLIYTHNKETETLICLAVDPNDKTKAKPLTVRKFDKLMFKW